MQSVDEQQIRKKLPKQKLKNHIIKNGQVHHLNNRIKRRPEQFKLKPIAGKLHVHQIHFPILTKILISTKFITKLYKLILFWHNSLKINLCR